MDSSFTRPLVCLFYFLLSSATLYLSFAYWNERVYVFGDDGGGVIYYERVPLLP